MIGFGQDLSICQLGNIDLQDKWRDLFESPMDNTFSIIHIYSYRDMGCFAIQGKRAISCTYAKSVSSNVL